jgi:hypothetical protein
MQLIDWIQKCSFLNATRVVKEYLKLGALVQATV